MTIPILNKSSLAAVCCLSLTLSLSTTAVAMASTAATAPERSHCLTDMTIKLHDDYLAQMETDIKPYANVGAMAEAIQSYRNGLAEGWEAMKNPYCGYGAYGAASSIKSFSKTATRLRATFLKQAKGKAKSLAAATPAITTVAAPLTATTKAPTLKTPHSKSMRMLGFFRGLHKGMRSDKVAELQRKLVAHYSLPDDGDHVTGYFGNVTRGLVIKFQKEKGIITSDTDPGAGQIGPLTSAALDKLED